MGFNNTTLTQLYQVQLPFNTTELKLMNRKAEKHGNGYYIVSGLHDMVLLDLSDSAHSSISYSTGETLLATDTATNLEYL